MSYLSNSLNSVKNQPLTLEQIEVLAPSAFAIAPHVSRSERYVYIPTSKVITAMMSAGFMPFSAAQSKSRILGKAEFTKHMIRFRHTQHTAMQELGDTIPEVVLINSHDGTSQYKLIAGMIRLACLNGMVVADGTVESISVMHKGNIIDAVIDGSEQIIHNTQRALTAAKDWSKLQLTDGEQKVYAEAAHSIRFADADGKADTPITAEQLLRTRRYADNGNDLWHTFNRVQENVIKGGLRGRDAETGRRETTRRVKSIDGDVKLNRALWQLTEKMAELKAA